MRRRKTAIFFLVLGISLSALAVALNVGWIILNLRQAALLVFGVIFFALIITGIILNTIFLVREIRRNEQHDAFLNAVTHELKTPLASIRLYLDTLRTREPDAEKRREFYDIMHEDSERLLGTVEQVLLASRTREKGLGTESDAIGLVSLIEESIAFIGGRRGLAEDAIRFVPPPVEIEVTGDRVRVR
jgi:signal transduction histidine kinase